MPWQKQTILALSVWLIYLADRWLDTSLRPVREYETARHKFSSTHGGLPGWVVPSLTLILMVITPRWLSPADFLEGIGLLALASLYFFATHYSSRQGWMSSFPKEAAVGTLFSLGTIALVLPGQGHQAWTIAPCVGGFAILCFLNCALITRWERTGHDLLHRFSLLHAFPGLVDRLSLGCFILSACALAWSLIDRSEVLLPVAASAVLLGWLDTRHDFFSPDALRVLSDVVLLTPLLLAPFQP